MLEQRPTQNIEEVQSLYDGIDHEASWERSYNADGQVYTSTNQLRLDWQTFLQASRERNRRRTIMRCYIASELLDQLTDLPIEAAIPLRDEYLIWIGQNQHEEVSVRRDIRNLPQVATTSSPEYITDTVVKESDIDNLIQLWSQFGWTPDGIRNFVRSNANGNPIALIRDMEQQAIGAMIAESVEFGLYRLVEITELAVNPAFRGQNLATILIRELTRQSFERWGDALVFGEYNLSTKSYRSAARAGQLPGRVAGQVDGVLRDHVGIEIGDGNPDREPWNLRWLHNFLVMYQPNKRIQR